MIQLSKFPFKTQKTRPTGSDNISTGILLQAGFIRQTMAGVYTYTTLGQKIYNNIENIVREEMDAIGAFETKMPNLSPKELWDKTNRWDIDVLFHVPAANNKEYALNCTHEEIATPLVGDFIQSYKDLPTCIYQIQYKFRNEKRAKSGLLRGREFIMKDAYSFHSSDEDFVEYYEAMKQAYMRIFERLGLGEDTVIAVADGGTFTDKYSHEFQVRLGIGEDDIYKDPVSGICYNQEITPSKVAVENIEESELKEREDIEAYDIIGVQALCEHLGVDEKHTTKTMMFEADENRFIVASVRGDYNINTLKLQKILGAKTLNLASAEKVKEITGAEIGYAGLVDLPEGVELYIDDSIEGLCNFETGTNKTGYHSININFGKDINVPEKFYDFKDARLGDKNPETGEVYEVFSASEIGNIFPLETKFTEAFGVKYLDENNKEQTPLMGCYGIGVSRAMGIVAEYFAGEKGIKWPEHIAPATHYIIVIGEENIDKAKELCKELEEQGNIVILDDRMGRKFGFGQKAGDCELWGIPNRIVLSPKTLEKGGYEIMKRGGKPEIVVSF